MSLKLLRETIEPLGHRVDGTPFWALFGAEGAAGGDGGAGDGSGEDDGDDDDSDDSGGEDEDDDKIGNDGLTGKGRKAVLAERAAADRARKALKPFQQLRRETGLTIEEMRERLAGTKGKGKAGEADKADAPDVDALRRQAQREANDRLNTKLIRAAVRAEATEFLADPKDAARFLDLTDYEVDDDGEVDSRQIQRDLKALIADKPYLAKTVKKGNPRGGSPNFDGGSRVTSEKTDMSSYIRDAVNRRR